MNTNDCFIKKNMKKSILNFQEVENGVTIDTYNYTGTDADYIDFRSDNKCIYL